MNMKKEEDLRRALHNRVDIERALMELQPLWGRQLTTDPPELAVQLEIAWKHLAQALETARKREKELVQEARER